MNRNRQEIESRKPYAERRHPFYLFLFSACLLFGISSCIYEKLDDCRQGIIVRLYSKTPCAADTVYPAVQGLKMGVFDRNNLLVSYWEDDNLQMQPHQQKTIEAENGLFTVVAWVGLGSDSFDLKAPQKGTAKNDLLFRLRRAAQQAISIAGKQIYFGESTPVFLPDPAEYGSVFDSTAINLQEITNRITVLVEGLPRTDDYEVFIESANGSMNFDGSLAADDVLQYTAPSAFTEGVLEAKFTMLQLITGYNSALVIKDKQLDRELYRGDLLGTLLLRNPNINLACTHDFTIRFTTKDHCQCGTYMIAEIWVNQWLVHSYDTDL